MNYNIELTSIFKKNAKKLSKKYASFKEEIDKFITDLPANPEQGTGLGHNCYKVRLAIESKEKGKSGGARINTCLKVTETTVYLLTIYDKGDQDTISDKELKDLIALIP